jgi:hypothetical protein
MKKLNSRIEINMITSTAICNFFSCKLFILYKNIGTPITVKMHRKPTKYKIELRNTLLFVSITKHIPIANHKLIKVMLNRGNFRLFLTYIIIMQDTKINRSNKKVHPNDIVALKDLNNK